MHQVPPEICVTAERAEWAYKLAKLAQQMDDLAVEIAAARILDAFALCEMIPIGLIERAERFVIDNNLQEVIAGSQHGG
jgi:hypothetical protein